MNTIAWDKETNIPVTPERTPNDGEWCRVQSGSFIEFKQYHSVIIESVDSEYVESEWVNSELLRTDELAKLLDYPHKDKLYAYRQELRDYMLNGDRPEQRMTQKGTLI